MSRSTADHFTCGNASISFFNSTGIDNVTVAMISPYVNVRKYVYKHFAAFEPIISIEKKGSQHVYDLAIENTHNFIANGIIAHNTYVKGLGNAINMSGNVLLMHFNNDSANGENQTNPKDWSGNRNNGTWFGGQFNVTAKLGAQAGQFGVNTHISINDNTSLRPTSLTISTWVKPDTLGIYSRIVSKGNNSARDY